MKQVFTAHNETEEGNLEGYRYCPLCGTELAMQGKDGRQRPTCTACTFIHYRNPRPGIVVVLEQAGAVPLGKRSRGLGAGRWGLPKGIRG